MASGSINQVALDSLCRQFPGVERSVVADTLAAANGSVAVASRNLLSMSVSGVPARAAAPPAAAAPHLQAESPLSDEELAAQMQEDEIRHMRSQHGRGGTSGSSSSRAEQHAMRNQLEEELKQSQAREQRLLSERNSLNDNLQRLHSEMARLQEEINTLRDEYRAKDDELAKSQEEMKRLQEQCEMEIGSVRSKFAREMESLRKSYHDQIAPAQAALEASIKAKDAELQKAQDEIQGIKSKAENDMAELKRQHEETILSFHAELRAQVAGAKKSLEAAESRCQEREKIISLLQRRLAAHVEEISELEQRRRHDEMLRRKLHNEIQELKGNIRVFCRVRPLLSDDGEGAITEYPEDMENTIIMSNGQGVAHQFSFDRIFPEVSTQAEVFDEVSQLVQSALDGYHVCIFAYGVTGSGKTYTMEGPVWEETSGAAHRYDTSEHGGVIPRTVEKIFSVAENLRDQGWEYTLEASFLEIYNESIRDLLAEPGTNLKYEVKQLPDGNVAVSNMLILPVRDPNEVHDLLIRASRQRSWAATRLNANSSRSHSVFQLFIKGHNHQTGAASEGLLNLIDLAGSERLKQTGHTGDRQNETKHINKSLACLGDVIAAIANKSSHVPYRNSKLTHLLAKSLGGNSKTLMFVNISPAMLHLSESVNSLRFAAKVNSCDIGTARRKVEIQR